MRIRLKSLRGNRRLRFHLGLAFLIWSLIPHYGFLVHSHAGGSHGHFHNTLSKSDLAEANAVLETLEGPQPSGIVVFSKAQEPKRAQAPSQAGAPGDRKVRDTDTGNRHAHSWADANFVSLSSQSGWVLPDVLPPLEAFDPYLAPDLIPVFDRPARGPPAFLLS